MIFGHLEPKYDPISYTRHPINHYFIFCALNHVSTDEKFDSICICDMALIPKLCEKTHNLVDLKNIFFWTFGVHIWPHILSRHYTNTCNYFIFWTLTYVCTKEKFDSIYGWYGSNGHYVWKMANFYVIFYDFLDLWSPDGTHILHQTPYEWLFYLWDTQSCM